MIYTFQINTYVFFGQSCWEAGTQRTTNKAKYEDLSNILPCKYVYCMESSYLPTSQRPLHAWALLSYILLLCRPELDCPSVLFCTNITTQHNDKTQHNRNFKFYLFFIIERTVTFVMILFKKCKKMLFQRDLLICVVSY